MEQYFIHQSRIRQVFYLTCVVLLGILLATQLSSFLPALLGAITLYVLMRKPMLYLVDKKGWSKSLAIWMLMLLSLVLIMLPIAALAGMISSKVTFAMNNSTEVLAALKKLVSQVETRFDLEIITQENLDKMSQRFAAFVPKLIGATFSTLGTLFFMYFILYFMLANYKNMESHLYQYVPLKSENVDKLGAQINNVVVSNAVGIPVIAIMQGIVGLIGYFILGVKDPWFWFVITCITAMLPVVGAAVAYVPISLIFFANEQTWQGFAMLIYGFGLIGTVDNLFRFTIAKKIGNVHPLITVFGVIIGLQLFGFIGLIFGPLLISLFVLLLSIYTSEFFVRPKDAAPDESPT